MHGTHGSVLVGSTAGKPRPRRITTFAWLPSYARPCLKHYNRDVTSQRGGFLCAPDKGLSRPKDSARKCGFDRESPMTGSAGWAQVFNSRAWPIVQTKHTQREDQPKALPTLSVTVREIC